MLLSRCAVSVGVIMFMIVIMFMYLGSMRLRNLVFVVAAVRIPMAVTMVAAAEQHALVTFTASPKQAIGSASANRMGTGGKDAQNRFITNQNRDQRENDRAGESCQVAELAGAEGKSGIVRMLTRVRVGEGSQKQRTRVRAHV